MNPMSDHTVVITSVDRLNTEFDGYPDMQFNVAELKADPAKCLALVIKWDDGTVPPAVALVIDTTTGTIRWDNPANETGVTGNYLAALLSVQHAEELQQAAYGS